MDRFISQDQLASERCCFRDRLRDTDARRAALAAELRGSSEATAVTLTPLQKAAGR